MLDAISVQLVLAIDLQLISELVFDQFELFRLL